MGATGRPKTTENPKELWTVVEDAWEGLVSKELWERVQTKLTKRTKATTAGKKKNKDVYLLSGIARCGHCGAKMYGMLNSRKKGKKRYTWAKYCCSTYYTQGKSSCGCHSVDQGKLLAVLIQKLQGVLRGDGGREALRHRVVTELKNRESIAPGQVEAQRTRLADLDTQLEKAAENNLATDDSIRDILARKMEGMRSDRDRAAAELSALEATKPANAEAEADVIADRVWGLQEELGNAKPARLRELVRRLVERIDLYFTAIPKKTRTEYQLEHGDIVLQPDPSLCVLKHVSRGDWTPVELFDGGVRELQERYPEICQRIRSMMS